MHRMVKMGGCNTSPPPVSLGSARQDIDNWHFFSLTSPYSCFTFTHGLCGCSYILPNMNTYVKSWDQTLCRVLTAAPIGLICVKMSEMDDDNSQILIIIECVCLFQLWVSLPSQVSHISQLVQSLVVLRSGQLQVLSSAITWFFFIQCSACNLHTLRRIEFSLIGLVVHKSKDELVRMPKKKNYYWQIQ